MIYSDLPFSGFPRTWKTRKMKSKLLGLEKSWTIENNENVLEKSWKLFKNYILNYN